MVSFGRIGDSRGRRRAARLGVRVLGGRNLARLLSATLAVGLAFPAAAQDASSGSTFVGLPPPSTLIGPLRLLPDGRIVAVPKKAQPGTHLPAHAPRAHATGTPATTAVKPLAPHAIPNSVTVTPSASTPALRKRMPRKGGRGEAAAAAIKPPPPGAVPATANVSMPPPRMTIVSQIHNAPGWEPAHTYRYATGPYTRVVSGPGWTPATDGKSDALYGTVSASSAGAGQTEPPGRFHPGRPVDAYQLTSRGTCTSAPDGGPTGTGAAIKDGTCTWKHLSRVDYVSLTGWAFDNQPWKSGTLYHFLDSVIAGSPLRAYALQDDSCASTVAPSGAGTSSVIATSDGCHWQYEADILYTSRRSYIPTETFTDRRSAATVRMQANYEAQLWNDREYVAGQNGEAAPIRTQDHNDYRHEGGVVRGCPASGCYHLIIATAPGESFRDSLTPADPLIGYDPTKGVAIRDTLPYRSPYEPAGIDVHDNLVDLIGLQIKSVHGAAVNGMSSFGNVVLIRDCILEGGSTDPWTSHAAVTTDTSAVIANSLIISHGPIGIDFKYPGYALHDTIVNPDRVANSVGVTTWHNWVFKGQTVSDTAIFGFAHAAASTADSLATDWRGITWLGGHNVTDAPRSGSGLAPSAYGNGVKLSATVYTLPGTTYSAGMAAAFVKPGRDWRPKRGSPLIGAGNAFGAFAVGCGARHPDCPQRIVYDFDSPDIIGTARPQAGRYDIGAWQSCPQSGSGHGVRCSPARRSASVER